MSRLRKPLEDRGFTYIELMVTVATLGIILAIAIPYYLGHKDRVINDHFGGTLQFPDGSFESWPADLILKKSKEDPATLYLVNRSGGLVKVFKLNKPEVITLDSFRRQLQGKNQ